MIIDLPRSFRFIGGTHKDYAEVKEGVLHLYGMVCFRKVMYNITFTIYGKKRCYYCGCIVRDKDITLDHMWAQDMGGPTISNNLVPCCKNCNSDKSNLSSIQYITYMKLNNSRKEEYRKIVAIQQELVKKGKAYELPTEWVTYANVSKFIVRVELKRKYKGRKYDRIKAFYNAYGYLQKPVIVDKNHFLLDGYITLMFAKENGIERIPVIVLENVEMHF